jgi:ABC-type nitrate/sulfonate/bicarbonate transport system substrate-binding protein
MGTKAGIFEKHGIEISFPTFEVGGPESAAGMMRGEWDFVQTGTVPMAETVLKGGDAVILLRNTADHISTFIMTPAHVTELGQLTGKKVGVLTDAYSGQTGVITRKTLEQHGAHAEYVGLGTYQNIYRALAEGRIDAGAMQIDMRFSGERQHGWRAFETVPFGLPSIFGTTRTKIAADRELALSMVRAVVETIYIFKSRPEVVVPLLQEFLEVDDEKVVADIHHYYVPLFPAVPRPELGRAMPALRELFAGRYEGAHALQEDAITDTSLIDDVERSGFITLLYSGRVELSQQA